VRSQQLEAAIAAFLEDAGRRLQTDVACGAEVGFEVERRGHSAARTPLYCYRPLTSEFIGERWRALGGLDSYRAAVAQLERFEGLERYIGGPGEQPLGPARSGAELALWMLLDDVFADQTEFELRGERVEDVLARLDGCALARADETTLVATLQGMAIASDELRLSGTLLIARPGTLRDMPEEIEPVGPTDEIDHLLLVYTSQADAAEAAGEEGAAAFRDVLCALRLFGDARVSLGGLAWARGGAGRWRPLPLLAGGRPHGMLVLAAAQEDELRAFCSLVARRTPVDNEIAWALHRFQLGCERELETEALSDYLLALRALLEPAGSPRGVLAGRLAALCAMPDDRPKLAALVARASELEQELIRGRAPEGAASERLVRTLGDHLRALLRDVICGHLDADLSSLADELLLEAGRATTHAPPRVGAHDDVEIWEEPGEAWQNERARRGAPQAAPTTRAPVKLGREPMPVADELDDDQLRLIGMPG